jgi:hypothetical protein
VPEEARAHREHNAEHVLGQRRVQAQACERCDARQPQRPRAGKRRAGRAAERQQQLARCARVLAAVHDARQQQQQLRLQCIRQACMRNPMTVCLFS